MSSGKGDLTKSLNKEIMSYYIFIIISHKYIRRRKKQMNKRRNKMESNKIE
jgi:hypothetical protein